MDDDEVSGQSCNME